MANYWLHNGFLQVEGEKMSKSLGNFITIHDLLKDWPGEVLRLNMLRTHYRQPIDWTAKGLKESEKTLDRWYRFVGDIDAADEPYFTVVDALKDDLNTHQAISELHSLASPPEAGLLETGVSRLGNPGGDEAKRYLKSSANLLGLLQGTEHDWFRSDAALKRKMKRENGVEPLVVMTVETTMTVNAQTIPSVDKIEQLIAERLLARKEKNFAEADRIRDKLAAKGIQLKDGKNPETGEIETTWEVKR